MAKRLQRGVEGREGGGAHLFFFCSRTVAQRRRARTRERRDRGAVHAASQLLVFADAQKLHKAAQASSLSRWLARGASPAAKMRIMRAWTSLGSCANAVSRRANAAAMRSMAGSRKGSSGAALVCSPRGAAGEIGDVERARLLKEPGAGRAWRGPAPACDARSPGPCAATAAQPLRPSCAAAAAPSLSTTLAATAASVPRQQIRHSESGLTMETWEFSAMYPSRCTSRADMADAQTDDTCDADSCATDSCERHCN